MSENGHYRFLCECGRPSCRERLDLPPHRYLELRRSGTVLHVRCALRDRRTILERFGAEVVVCLTAAKAMA